ncbi:hypothetical protein AB6A40_002828 [Gnathostoma spinigerum]|uniref:Uncharacterized protein n=1 Tax=Gnathostoma spinigerum TaxID=75299 RepID=A0ABD6ED90_9BILA
MLRAYWNEIKDWKDSWADNKLKNHKGANMSMLRGKIQGLGGIIGGSITGWKGSWSDNRLKECRYDNVLKNYCDDIRACKGSWGDITYRKDSRGDNDLN